MRVLTMRKKWEENRRDYNYIYTVLTKQWKRSNYTANAFNNCNQMSTQHSDLNSKLIQSENKPKERPSHICFMLESMTKSRWLGINQKSFKRYNAELNKFPVINIKRNTETLRSKH